MNCVPEGGGNGGGGNGGGPGGNPPGGDDGVHNPIPTVRPGLFQRQRSSWLLE